MSEGPRFPAWTWVFPAIGGLRLLAWFLSGGWDQATAGLLIGLILTLAFGVGGALLIWAGRPQPGPMRLGGAFVLVASAFVPATALASTGALPMRLLSEVRPEFLLGAFLWGFAAVFPSRSTWAAPNRMPNRLAAVAAVGGGLASIVLLTLPDGAAGTPAWSQQLHRLAWIVTYILSGAALLYIAGEARRARSNERRRVTLFITGILLGSAPAVCGSLVLLLFAPVLEYLRARPLALAAYRLVSYAGLATIPVVTLYAVLETRVLGLRDVARSSIRTLLARQAAFAATVAPSFALGALLVLRGQGVVHSAVASMATIGSGVLAVVGAVALLSRRRILAFVDQRFFPEEHRVDLALARLSAEVAEAASMPELVGLVRTGVETAMGLTRASLLELDAQRRTLRSPRAELRPLGLSSAAEAAFERREPIRPHARTHRSDAELHEWAAESGIELIIPFRTEVSAGAIGVGVKNSGMPFTRDDEHRLLRISAAAGRRLEQVRRTQDEERRAVTPSARDCTGCGSVNPSTLEQCARCGSSLRPSPLPFVLAGKFRLLELIGSGAGGVVYAASDLDLGRRVAIKTLAWSREVDATGLYEEARVMARLSHPALATIFGLEMYGGTPVLVLELFDAGSLRDRLRRGPLDWAAAFAMGATLAAGLEYLHARQLLHGDVKPSNIGITSAGECKLLDFGLTRIVDSPITADTGASVPGLEQRAIRGTAAYLPPEVHDAGQIRPGADLWGLAVVVYEAIAGRHPYANAEGRLPAGRILTGAVPDIREIVADCPEPVARTLATLLAADADARPGTATQLIECFRLPVGLAQTGRARL